MHQCLTIEEVLRIIIEFAADVDPFGDPNQLAERKLSRGYQTDLRTLLYIALTCKTFHNPALDRLWRQQWGLENLVALLPKSQTVLILIVDSPETANLILIQGRFETITGQDWARFDIYARRVKALDVSENCFCPEVSAPKPSRSALETLRTRAKPILPSLEHFVWSYPPVSSELLSYFDMFLGPTVAEFFLDTRGVLQVSEAESKVLELPLMSPALKHFRFSALGTQQLKLQLPKIVSSLPMLHLFTCGFVNISFSVELLSVLSTHPKLEHLELYVVSDPGDHPIVEQESPPAAAVQITFTRLQHLALGATMALLCADALKCMKLPALKDIKLEIASNDGLCDALAWIGTSCSSTALKVLEVTGGDDDEVPIFTTRNDLAILQKFKGLTSLAICGPFNLTDGDLKSVAAWWPHLEMLSLGQDGWRNAPRRVTLAGLLELVKGCPHLSEVALAFNPLLPADFDPQGHCNERVTSLGVADSPVDDDPQVIADRLKTLFPMLESINASEFDTEAQIEWDQVELSL
ncbi:hypothetical protein EIP86_005144 [Pleurotus ostreatoroseus]|nr:hypothetical protein EIP86_005144 [Pleurotus ostreatoroseus]